MSKIQNIDEDWLKLANIDREFLHTFWTAWGNSMKLSGKVCLKIILKVTKKYFTKEKLHFSLICSFCCCLVKNGWALKVAEQFAIRGLVAYKSVVYKK